MTRVSCQRLACLHQASPGKQLLLNVSIYACRVHQNLLLLRYRLSRTSILTYGFWSNRISVEHVHVFTGHLKPVRRAPACMNGLITCEGQLAVRGTDGLSGGRILKVCYNRSGRTVGRQGSIAVPLSEGLRLVG